jgi:hypothetical protein
VSTQTIDYDALAQQHGAQADIDYDALAAQHGASGVQTAKPKTGAFAGVVRGVKNLAHMPGQLYDSISKGPQNDDEKQIYENGIDTPQGHLPGALALPFWRVVGKPMADADDKADAYEKAAAAEKDPKIKAQLEDAAGAHRIAAKVPLVGPVAAELAERASYGEQGPSKLDTGGRGGWANRNADVSGALAEGTTYAAAPAAAEGATDLALAKTGPAVRATARLVNKTLEKAPGAVGGTIVGAAGAAVGHATGIPYATLAAEEIGRNAGVAAGKAILPNVRIPGEGFGLPSRVTGGPVDAPPFVAPMRLAPDLPAAFQSLPARPPGVPGTADTPFQGPLPAEPVRQSPPLPAAFQPLPPRYTPPVGTADVPFQVPERFTPPGAAGSMADSVAAPASAEVAPTPAGAGIPRTFSGESALRQVLTGQDTPNLMKIAKSRGINVTQESQLKPSLAGPRLINKIIGDFSEEELDGVGNQYLESTRMGKHDFGDIGAEAWKTLAMKTYFPDVKIPVSVELRTARAITDAAAKANAPQFGTVTDVAQQMKQAAKTAAPPASAPASPDLLNLLHESMQPENLAKLRARKTGTAGQ